VTDGGETKFTADAEKHHKGRMHAARQSRGPSSVTPIPGCIIWSRVAAAIFHHVRALCVWTFGLSSRGGKAACPALKPGHRHRSKLCEGNEVETKLPEEAHNTTKSKGCVYLA
jgi:hypothetical protein